MFVLVKLKENRMLQLVAIVVARENCPDYDAPGVISVPVSPEEYADWSIDPMKIRDQTIELEDGQYKFVKYEMRSHSANRQLEEVEEDAVVNVMVVVRNSTLSFWAEADLWKDPTFTIKGYALSESDPLEPLFEFEATSNSYEQEFYADESFTLWITKPLEEIKYGFYLANPQ